MSATVATDDQTKFRVYLEKRIKADQEYSIGDVAKLCRRSPQTIRNWCEFGFSIRRRGMVVLQHHWYGCQRSIVGNDLVDFLMIIQKEE